MNLFEKGYPGMGHAHDRQTLFPEGGDAPAWDMDSNGAFSIFYYRDQQTVDVNPTEIEIHSAVSKAELLIP